MHHTIVWSCTAGPGLSPEESDPRAEEVGELHNGPQEESDIRRHRAVGFRPEQPYLRTLTLPDEDGGTPAPPACEPTGPSTSCAAAAPSPRTTTNLTAGRSQRARSAEPAMARSETSGRRRIEAATSSRQPITCERTRTPHRTAATPVGDAEDESPTTTGSRRQPRPPSARRSPPPPSSGAGFARRTHPAAAGGGTCCRGERGRRT